MARLGIATIDEMVGRTDLLTVSDSVQEPHKGKVDLSAILNNPYAGKGKVTFDPKVYTISILRKLWMKKFWSGNVHRRSRRVRKFLLM